MMNIWLGNPETYFSKRNPNDAPRIRGVERMEHAHLPAVEGLIRPETCEIFGDVDLGRVHEGSCLAMVQRNEEDDVVSGVCLRNYPNVPSVPPEAWLEWLRKLYRVEHVTERNAMFVHFLAWDGRYTGRFFADLLTGLFDAASRLQHVLLVLPPGIILADVFEQELVKVPPRHRVDKPSLQSLFVTQRHLKNPRLRIRRAV